MHQTGCRELKIQLSIQLVHGKRVKLRIGWCIGLWARYEPTTLKLGSSMGINPNCHISRDCIDNCILSSLHPVWCMDMLIPNLEQTLFWNGDSPIWNFFWRLPITERELPVSEQGLYFFLSFDSRTTRSQKRGMILISEWGCQLLPVLKQGSPFQNGDITISNPIPKRGSPFQNGEWEHPRFRMGTVQSLTILE